MTFFKQFGGKITPSLQQQYALSSSWKATKFENLESTSMDLPLFKMPKLLYQQFFERKNRQPQSPLPILPVPKTAFLESSNESKFIWYGHSVILMRIEHLTLLIDPMLGSNASPIAPFATERFSKNTLELIEDFPEIDYVLLTHDHYDHLDYASIQKLKSKTKHYLVALGVKRHLVHWGISPEQITEFDWWHQKTIHNLEITFTPTRHFSGRGLTDRAKSLWGGWVFKTPSETIYFSGDGGYGAHFKTIQERFGTFDLAFMECGQYNEHWHQIHMYPEESVQAAHDVYAKKIIPVHWAGFALALHAWTDPVERFIEEVDFSFT